MKILLIQNGEVGARRIQRSLEANIHIAVAITWVETLRQGESELHGARYDLCLVDLGLPDCPGSEAVQRLRDGWPDLPLIGLVEEVEQAGKSQAALAAGADDVLEMDEWMSGRVERVLRHVVERRRFQKQLAEARDEIRATEAESRAKSEFLMELCNEVRMPMNAVLGLAELIENEQRASKKVKEHVQDIECLGSNLLVMIIDVLEMSRIESGLVRPVDRSFNLNQFLDGLGEIIEPCADAKGLFLNVEVDPGMPEMLVGDEAKLRQILVNLLSNAIKSTARGGVTLRAKPVESLEGEIRVSLEVEDSSAGIEEESLSRLFVPFEKVGIGELADRASLGLVLSRRLAQLMGGSLEVSSRLGEGSTFSLNLTFGVEPRVERNEPVPGVEIREDLRALVVDDNPSYRKLLSARLSMAGIRTVEAADGEEALDLFLKETPDVIFMDCRMPGTDGFKATRRIKQTFQGQSTPVIMVTAYAKDDDQHATRESGADAFLRKPVMTAELLDTLETCLSRGGCSQGKESSSGKNSLAGLSS